MSDVTAERIAALSGHVSEEYLADLRAQVDGDPEALADPGLGASPAERADRPDTIGEAKTEVAQLEDRIAIMDGRAPEDHVDSLRKERADLQRDIEHSKEKAKHRNALNSAFKSLARVQSDGEG